MPVPVVDSGEPCSNCNSVVPTNRLFLLLTLLDFGIIVSETEIRRVQCIGKYALGEVCHIYLQKLCTESVFNDRLLAINTSIDYCCLVRPGLVILQLSPEATDQAEACKQRNYLL